MPLNHPQMLIAFMLVLSLILTVLAIVAATKIRHFSLPVAPAFSVLTVLLPVLAAGANGQLSNLSCKSILPLKIKPLGARFILIQLLLAVAIGNAIITLSFLIPSSIQSCNMKNQWQQLFSSHAAATIRRIQDAHNCCGFLTNVNEAWPFPDGTHTARSCIETFGRTAPCAGFWRADLMTWTGVMLFVNVTVAGELFVWMWVVWQRATNGEAAPANGRSAFERRIAPAIVEYSDEEHRRIEDNEEEEPLRGPTVATSGLRI